MHWDYVILLAILAVYVPWRSAARIRELLEGPPLSSSGRVLLYLSTMAFQWIAVALLFWRSMAHHATFADLGIAFPYPGRTILLAALLSLLLVINQVVGLRRIAALPPEKRGNLALIAQRLLPRTPSETALAVMLVVTVALCEEFIYRGFAQSVFQTAFNNSILAGAASSAALFSIAHLYQGRKGIITTFIVGLIFSASRVWSGSLITSAVIHFMVDFSAGVAAAKFLGLEAIEVTQNSVIS